MIPILPPFSYYIGGVGTPEHRDELVISDFFFQDIHKIVPLFWIPKKPAEASLFGLHILPNLSLSVKGIIFAQYIAWYLRNTLKVLTKKL